MRVTIENFFGEYHLVMLSSAAASESAFVEVINRAQFDVTGEIINRIDVDVHGMYRSGLLCPKLPS